MPHVVDVLDVLHQLSDYHRRLLLAYLAGRAPEALQEALEDLASDHPDAWLVIRG